MNPLKIFYGKGFFTIPVGHPNEDLPDEPGSKLVVLGMVIQPLMGNPYNGYINPCYWVDDHPQLYGNNGSLDPSTHVGKVLLNQKPDFVREFLESF